MADELLFDAKPPPGAKLPGGNGVAFDWRILAALDLEVPFMLSGGLAPGTVGEAVRITRAPAVDVSSGVESAPGIKQPELIAAFVAAARAAGSFERCASPVRHPEGTSVLNMPDKPNSFRNGPTNTATSASSADGSSPRP